MPDCLVIGGGLIGLLTARELRLAGMEVAVVERGKLGGESSWAGGGIISPLYPWRYSDSVNVLAEHSKRLYPELCKQLEAESGIDCELLQSGMLLLQDDEVQQAQAWAQTYDVSIEYIQQSAALKKITPGISPLFERGLWMSSVNQIRNPKFVQALRGSCKTLGIQCYEQCEVLELITEDDAIKGLQLADQKLYCDKVVIASGAWSANLLRDAVTADNASVDVEPIKGQMIMLKTLPGMVKTIVMTQGHYIIPRRDGHVLCGSTLEHAGFDKSTSEQTREQLLGYATEIMPQLAEFPVVRHWAGLRPGTKQGIPYICEYVGLEGLYIHTGHYRNGIVLGAASARLMAEMITGKQPWCETAPYAMSASH